MKAVLLKGEREVEIGEIPEPEPQEGDAVIRVMAAGICGSEMGGYRGPKKDKPVPTGHEAAGIVEDVGDGVASLKPAALTAAEA